MSLSIPNIMAWDFTRESSPLASQIGQAATFALAGGATVDTTDGLSCITGSDRATLSCASVGDDADNILLHWTLPFTFFLTLTLNRTANVSGTSARFLARYASTTFLIGQDASNLTTGVLRARVNADAWNLPAIPDVTETQLLVEYRANGYTAWYDNVPQAARTDRTWTMPALNGTDTIYLGINDANNPMLKCKGCALIPGALSSGDRTALAADWRNALFGSSGPTPAAIAYYRRQLGGLTE